MRASSIGRLRALPPFGLFSLLQFRFDRRANEGGAKLAALEDAMNAMERSARKPHRQDINWH